MIKYGYEFPDDPSEETQQDQTKPVKEAPKKKKPTKEPKHDIGNDND